MRGKIHSVKTDTAGSSIVITIKTWGMIQKQLRWLLLAAAVPGLHLAQAQLKKNERPNIVFILADDMGYGDVSVYNPDSKISTPNMDRVAAEGMRFTDAHSPAALCSPTRYGFLTGRYCWKTRLKKFVLVGYDETPLIEKGQPTIGSVLQQKGYTTACIGKWHVGLNWPTRNGYVMQNDHDDWTDTNTVNKENERNIDFTKPVSGGPNDLGFNYGFITAGCSTSDPPYCYIENGKSVGIPDHPSPKEYYGLPGFAPGLMAPGFSIKNVDSVFTVKAIDFIAEQTTKVKKEPFFLYLALSSPHNPFIPPEFAAGKSKEGPRGDLVTVADWSVGQINAALEKYGLTKNTILIITSDNGAVRGANGHRSEWNFNGYKADALEGGHRVPFIIRWPGRIQAGAVNPELISHTDMFATFAALTGAAVPAGAAEDSYNVLPSFFGKPVPGNDTVVRIFHGGNGIFVIRKGNWKLISGTKSSAPLPNTGKLLQDQLYDLSADPYEKNNLRVQYPEKVQVLNGLLDEYIAGKRNALKTKPAP
jgi:arylsulfatase A